MVQKESTRRPSRGGWRAQTITILATAVTVAVATHAVAAIGAIPSDGRFTACYQTSDSVLNRILVLAEPGEQCPATYARVTWPAQASGGAAGPPGPQGPQGPAGPAGQAGVSWLGQVRVVSRTAELRSRGSRVGVVCNRGETAVGGGFDVNYSQGGRDLPVASYPLRRKGRPVGWWFEPVRVARVEGRTNLANVGTYITRVRGHNHELHLPSQWIAFDTSHVADWHEIPVKVDLYAICVSR